MGYQDQPALRHVALERLATRQHGVVSTAQLATVGYSRSSAAKAARVGRLHRLHRGVYAVGHRRLTWRGHCYAAILARGPAVASHSTAAWLWELSNYRPGSYEVTAPTKRRSVGGIRVHSADLPELDLGFVDDIPVTSIDRTVLDLAARANARRLAQILERTEELKAFDLRRFEALLGRTKGHPGHGKLSRALDLYRPQIAVSRSLLERRFAALVRAAGLPTPAQNVFVHKYEIDAYWAAERFGVELDVFATHGSRRSFEEDRERTDDLLALGVEITRVTDKRLAREPEAVMRRLGEHLARRAPSPPPSRRTGAPARDRR